MNLLPPTGAKNTTLKILTSTRLPGSSPSTAYALHPTSYILHPTSYIRPIASCLLYPAGGGHLPRWRAPGSRMHAWETPPPTTPPACTRVHPNLACMHAHMPMHALLTRQPLPLDAGASTWCAWGRRAAVCACGRSAAAVVCSGRLHGEWPRGRDQAKLRVQGRFFCLRRVVPCPHGSGAGTWRDSDLLLKNEVSARTLRILLRRHTGATRSHTVR